MAGKKLAITNTGKGLRHWRSYWTGLILVPISLPPFNISGIKGLDKRRNGLLPRNSQN
jgi:hypothetical protein